MNLDFSLILIGRFLLGVFFIIGAASDILQRRDLLQLMQQKKIPLTNVFMWCGIVLKLIAGLALVFNFHPILASILLVIFTFIANVIFNDFWRERGAKQQLILVRFFLYLAVIGGLFLVIAINLPITE